MIISVNYFCVHFLFIENIEDIDRTYGGQGNQDLLTIPYSLVDKVSDILELSDVLELKIRHSKLKCVRNPDTSFQS